jgi:hypothetical protein
MTMILELRHYTYHVDRNSQFVVPFPPTSIHTTVHPHPFVSSEGNGGKGNALRSSTVLNLDYSPPGDGHSLSWTSL